MSITSAGYCASGFVVMVVMSVLAVSPPAAIADDVVFTLPESQLLNDAEFGAKAWGPGTLAGRSDGPGSSVDFTFTGLGASGTGVKDNYPVDPVYGQVIPSHGNGDFSVFTGYALRVENLDASGVWFHLCINTGFTGASGTPPSDATNNTYWTSWPAWIYLEPGEDGLLVLDFDGATAWQISDNKAPHSGGGLAWPDGNVYAVNGFDRSEVSAIGFEIADFSGSNPDAAVRLTPASAEAYVTGSFAEPGQPPLALSLRPNPGSAAGVRMVAACVGCGRATPAAVAVYDSAGRRVAALWAGLLGPSAVELAWDGRNDAGLKCADGVYFVVLESGEHSVRQTLVLTQ